MHALGFEGNDIFWAVIACEGYFFVIEEDKKSLFLDLGGICSKDMVFNNNSST